jgi:hypothetical protein
MPMPLTTTMMMMMMMMRGQYECLRFHIYNNLLALPVEGTRGAREAAEELRRSAQEGAANPLRTSNSDDQGTPPRRATTDREREAFFCFFDCFWSVFAGLAYGIMQKQNSLFQRPETPVN